MDQEYYNLKTITLSLWKNLKTNFSPFRLQKKELSMDSDDYLHLDYVDQKDQRYVKRKDPTE